MTLSHLRGFKSPILDPSAVMTRGPELAKDIRAKKVSLTLDISISALYAPTYRLLEMGN